MTSQHNKRPEIYASVGDFEFERFAEDDALADVVGPLQSKAMILVANCGKNMERLARKRA